MLAQVPYQELCSSDGQFKPAPGAGEWIYLENPRQAGGPGAGFHFHLIDFLPQGGLVRLFFRLGYQQRPQRRPEREGAVIMDQVLVGRLMVI